MNHPGQLNESAVKVLNTWRLYLRARAAVVAILVWLIALIVVLASGPAVYELQVVASRLPRYVPIWEALPVVVGSLVPALMVPQMWSWERTGDVRKVRHYATASGVLAIVAPTVIPTVSGLAVLPDQARWADIAFNVATITSVAMIVTTVAGRVVGPLSGLASYLGGVAIQQVAPSLGSWVPLSQGDRPLALHACVSIVAASVAVTAWTISLGRTRTADRLRLD